MQGIEKFSKQYQLMKVHVVCYYEVGGWGE